MQSAYVNLSRLGQRRWELQTIIPEYIQNIDLHLFGNGLIIQYVFVVIVK